MSILKLEKHQEVAFFNLAKELQSEVEKVEGGIRLIHNLPAMVGKVAKESGLGREDRHHLVDTFIDVCSCKGMGLSVVRYPYVTNGASPFLVILLDTMEKLEKNQLDMGKEYLAARRG